MRWNLPPSTTAGVVRLVARGADSSCGAWVSPSSTCSLYIFSGVLYWLGSRFRKEERREFLCTLLFKVSYWLEIRTYSYKFSQPVGFCKSDFYMHLCLPI